MNSSLRYVLLLRCFELFASIDTSTTCHLAACLLQEGKVDDDCSPSVNRPWKVVEECVVTLIILDIHFNRAQTVVNGLVSGKSSYQYSVAIFKINMYGYTIKNHYWPAKVGVQIAFSEYSRR